MWREPAWEQSHLTFKNFAFRGYSLCFGGGFLDNKPSLNVKDEQVFPLLWSAKFLIGLSTFSCTLLEPMFSKIKETQSPYAPWGAGNPNHRPEPPSAKFMIRPLLTWRLAKPLLCAHKSGFNQRTSQGRSRWESSRSLWGKSSSHCQWSLALLAAARWFYIMTVSGQKAAVVALRHTAQALYLL